MGQMVSLGRIMVNHILPYLIKMSPFMALYGYHPPSITSKEKIAQNRMKRQENQHRNGGLDICENTNI